LIRNSLLFQFKNQIQLVAVSKTKPVEAILEAYSVGQRHFGENYIQELEEKSNDPKILENCKDIKWHFIGHLQTNKVKKMAKIPNIHMIQTIHSEKLADNLNKLWEKEKLETEGKLKVLIQVNTSGEDVKNGIEPDKALEVYDFINEKCKALQCEGLMTIGAFGFDYSTGPNPDFVSLMECRDHFQYPESLQMSFGMSDDFEQAVSSET
jgi:PLP dependent protein